MHAKIRAEGEDNQGEEERKYTHIMMVACINEIIIINYLIIIANAATPRRLAVTIVRRDGKKKREMRETLSQ